MSPPTIALACAGCIFTGTVVGLVLRRFLPEHHFSPESKEAVKVGAGMVSMMSALVLGLLVSSAKSNFDSTDSAITQASAKVILLDRVLASYGPEAAPLRQGLRRALQETIKMLWPGESQTDPGLNKFEQSRGLEELLEQIRGLAPQTDSQRTLQAQAQQLANELLLSRWLQIEQAQTSTPPLFLGILLFWLTMLYVSFGLLAPNNPTVIAVMFVGALALGTAIFLILEMNSPMEGAIKVPSGPMLKALEHLGK